MKNAQRAPKQTGPKTKASKGERKYERHMVTMPPELYDRLQGERGLVPMATYICMLIEKGLEANVTQRERG